MTLRYVAFYLPQYHPIPENDAWWGKGFTEWTNVTKAKPLFEGHYQPHLPADLGFYDLRVRETQRDQSRIAMAHGIDAFCFHYFWFNGHRLLQRPIDDFAADKSIPLQYCLCFPNENWTRRWDAAENHVLIEQKYSPGWEAAFIDSVIPYFRDERYIRIDGKPLLIVYRPQHIPDPRKAAAIWRERCEAAGLGGVHLCAALIRRNSDFKQFDFDSGVEFPPHNVSAPELRDRVPMTAPFTGNVYRYGDIASEHTRRDYSGTPVFRTVFPSWDNTARVADRALVVLDSTPQNYETWLRRDSRLTVAEREEDWQLVFINAWNEWAEGCHLEPDRKFGTKYLEATLRAKRSPVVPANDRYESPESDRLRVAGTPSSSDITAAGWARNTLEKWPPAFRFARAVYHLLRRARHYLRRV
jgi:lipopolysaccharide biosynthesis protein